MTSIKKFNLLYYVDVFQMNIYYGFHMESGSLKQPPNGFNRTILNFS